MVYNEPNPVVRLLLFLIMLLIGGVPYVNPVYASSVEEVDLPEIASNSELIFEGQVIGKQVRRHPEDGRPMTYFTFRIDDIVKGEYDGSTVELGFEGGTIDGLTSVVGDLEMPVMGERGIYFVESLELQLVHPLYGWNQGHFLIRTDDDGTQRVNRLPSHATVRAKTTTAPGKQKKLDQIFSTSPSVRDFKREIRNQLGD